ncbi:hypothetical protein BDR04DRAFT_1102633, partial [Suillus decipiens]
MRSVRFDAFPPTDHNSMDVDDSDMSQTSLDSLSNVYLGPDDDIEDDYVSYSGTDVLQAIPDQSLLAQGEAPNFFT